MLLSLASCARWSVCEDDLSLSSLRSLRQGLRSLRGDQSGLIIWHLHHPHGHHRHHRAVGAVLLEALSVRKVRFGRASLVVHLRFEETTEDTAEIRALRCQWARMLAKNGAWVVNDGADLNAWTWFGALEHAGGGARVEGLCVKGDRDGETARLWKSEDRLVVVGEMTAENAVGKLAHLVATREAVAIGAVGKGLYRRAEETVREMKRGKERAWVVMMPSAKRYGVVVAENGERVVMYLLRSDVQCQAIFNVLNGAEHVLWKEEEIGKCAGEKKFPGLVEVDWEKWKEEKKASEKKVGRRKIGSGLFLRMWGM